MSTAQSAPVRTVTSDTRSTVRQICIDMAAWEEAGADTAQVFQGILHPQLRFRRANGDVDTMQDFIGKLGSGANQGRTLHGEVDVIHYEAMAVAGLVVQQGDGKRFRNARIFLQGGPRGWLLISWCNERIST